MQQPKSAASPTTVEPVTAHFDRVDAERVVRGRPVRIPVSRAAQRNYSGLYWSSTTQAHLVYESLLERDRLLLADFCPAVAWMAAQLFWMRGYDGSTFRRHVPDLLLHHRDGAFTVVDVKPERMTKKPKVIDVLKWTDRMCRERGWQYEVWSGTNPTEALSQPGEAIPIRRPCRIRACVCGRGGRHDHR